VTETLTITQGCNVVCLLREHQFNPYNSELQNIIPKYQLHSKGAENLNKVPENILVVSFTTRCYFPAFFGNK
jgi:hypothetical protein